MKLESKIMLAVGLAIASATGLGVGIVYHLSSRNRVEELRGKMSSIIAQSEQVASNMDDMTASRVFDTAGLLSTAKKQANGRPLKDVYASTDLYKTIPIVAAWRSVDSSAKKNGFKFFTPSRPGVAARNPVNDNGADFSAAFQAFDKGATEFFFQDRAKDELVLARPVRLQASCLACHGDPAKSLTGDSKDPLGFPMENLHLGDIKGAFVLKANIGHDPVVLATMKAMALGGGVVLLAVLAGFYEFNRRVIVRPLAAAIRQIDEASARTAAAAAQITSASHSLAEGASEQAAALEQTSASLEEMASMTKRNCDSADKANSLARQARAAGDTGAEDMKAMNVAMAAIQSSSNEIGKIIKTIDEIAFQTNILALNAAVEAARAGEAGLGFAVVADEVRNLAQRCTVATKETTAKIEGATISAAQGVEISGKVARGLDEIVARVRQVDELAAEVAVASKEQSEGIAQINTAVTQMDQVTQANAAGAEESAGAANELSSQAVILKGAVGDLLNLVNGRATSQTLPPPNLSGNGKSGRLSQSAAKRPLPVRRQAPRSNSSVPPTMVTSGPAAASQVRTPSTPDLIVWDQERMTTGFGEIDEQHKELIQMINRLHQACLNGTGKTELGQMMKFLGEYVQTHFAHEEELMEKHRCPAKGGNKAAHLKFLQEFQKIAQDFETKGGNTAIVLGLKGLVAEWLTTHICNVDTKLRACARSGKGPAGKHRELAHA